jgi:hypothetical protein
MNREVAVTSCKTKELDLVRKEKIAIIWKVAFFIISFFFFHVSVSYPTNVFHLKPFSCYKISGPHILRVSHTEKKYTTFV